MKQRFEIGSRVEWNGQPGRVIGRTPSAYQVQMDNGQTPWLIDAELDPPKKSRECPGCRFPTPHADSHKRSL